LMRSRRTRMWDDCASRVIAFFDCNSQKARISAQNAYLFL
jgi:hypothetical protein